MVYEGSARAVRASSAQGFEDLETTAPYQVWSVSAFRLAAVKAAPHGLESSAFEIWVGRGRGGPLRQGFEAQGARPYRGLGEKA
ncbi:MAG: hypothetical protein EBT69_09525 [Verrucomicrobia bacterium]|nr:hypothetical protein [Verrucomicrobiota bacterium]